MLHILLLILKILGIIIVAILGILVLFICIVLFVPIRYELSAKCDGTLDSLKAKAKVTWLLHFLRADVLYGKKALKWRFRIAWLSRTNGAERVKKKGAEQNEKLEEKVEELEKTEEIIEKNVPEKEPEKIPEEKKTVVFEDKEESGSHKETSERKRESIFQKIKSTFQSICDKIKTLIEKKEKLTDFIKDEKHVGALKKAIKELRKLLKRLKPGKTNIKVRYGFEDPYTTGQILAGLGILYPFIGETTEIIPDFENQVLKGTVYIKGKIRLVHFMVLAWNLIWCKNVRTTYRDIKSFKL